MLKQIVAMCSLLEFLLFGERIVSHSRKLGTQLGVGIKTDEDRAFAKLLQTPKGILDWVSVPNFLDQRPKAMSPPGTFRPFSNVRFSVVVGDKPDIETQPKWSE
jgi:hypothetical protein